MTNFIYGLMTLILGLTFHITFGHYISILSVTPDVLLLMVVAHGFIMGPSMGATMGFCWGLMADTMGVNLFGLQTFLFSLAGFISGLLMRRVDSERPIPQMVISFFSTVFYGLMASFMRSLLEQAGQRVSLLLMIVRVLLNVGIGFLIFWALDAWVSFWRLHRE